MIVNLEKCNLDETQGKDLKIAIMNIFKDLKDANKFL